MATTIDKNFCQLVTGRNLHLVRRRSRGAVEFYLMEYWIFVFGAVLLGVKERGCTFTTLSVDILRKLVAEKEVRWKRITSLSFWNKKVVFSLDEKCFRYLYMLFFGI